MFNAATFFMVHFYWPIRIFLSLFFLACDFTENRRNKSTTSPICAVVPVLHFIECCRYTMVYCIDVAHSFILLFSAEILSLFIEVIFIDHFQSFDGF